MNWITWELQAKNGFSKNPIYGSNNRYFSKLTSPSYFSVIFVQLLYYMFFARTGQFWDNWDFVFFSHVLDDMFETRLRPYHLSYRIKSYVQSKIKSCSMTYQNYLHKDQQFGKIHGKFNGQYWEICQIRRCLFKSRDVILTIWQFHLSLNPPRLSQLLQLTLLDMQMAV